MLQGKAGMFLAIVVTFWILFQTGCKLYYAANPEKAVELIRKHLEVSYVISILGYTGWCFFMLLAFYLAGLYNF